MKELMVFGKPVMVEEKRAEKDLVQLMDGRIVIGACERPASSLLKEFLEDLLYSQLCKIYEEIRSEGKVELLGNLDFEIREKIDGRKDRIAKLKGNRILVKLSAVTSPENVLRYVLAHEMAHIFTKRHSKRFWRIVETICPDFEEGQRLFMEYHDLLVYPDLRWFKVQQY